MKFQLRDYQQRAFDSVIDHIKYCLDSCIVEAATGSGKSHIIAEVAEWIYNLTGKRVLITAPTSILVKQNHSKYPGKASIFCATAGRKELKHPVVFGSPQSILNSIDKFSNQFCAVIVDEGDGLTPTLKKLIANLKDKNPNLRVIGFTGTPYRMRTGYIYEYDLNDNIQEDAIEPYYKKLVCKITAQELIKLDWLNPPISVTPKANPYDTTGLVKNNLGFTKDSIETVYRGQGRKTAAIVAEVVELSKDRHGVMFFAQTIEHAKEIMDSLPPWDSWLIIGETKGREKILREFGRMAFKYIVNVNVLTVGFDSHHLDVLAFLRLTESARLFEQMLGRGTRLCDYTNKKDFLVLDYAGNIDYHELEDDLFTPKIKTWESKETKPISVECPQCGNLAEFGFRSDNDYKDFKFNEHGYFIDLLGGLIQGDHGPVPAHYGRRCVGGYLNEDGHFDRCTYRWTFKPCEHCEEENDIAARRCRSCKKEMVNPNDKLRLEFKRMKRDPKALSTDKVLSWDCVEHCTGSRRIKVKATFRTEYRAVPIWASPDLVYGWNQLCKACGIQVKTVREFLICFARGTCIMPRTITSRKAGDFFRVSDYNLKEDVEP